LVLFFKKELLSWRFAVLAGCGNSPGNVVSAALFRFELVILRLFGTEFWEFAVFFS